jgi:hypothetical protein
MQCLRPIRIARLAAWQGFWVVKVAVPSFGVTLSGLLAFRGIGYYVSGARTIAPISKSFSFLCEGFIPPTASYFVLAAVYAIAAVFLIRAHRRGAWDGDRARLLLRHLMLLGSGGAARVDLLRVSRHPVGDWIDDFAERAANAARCYR